MIAGSRHCFLFYHTNLTFFPLLVYHERWEIEACIDEQKTHLRLSGQPGSGSLEQDGPLSIVAMQKEEQTRLVHDH